MRDGLSDPNQKVATAAQNTLLDAAAHLLWSGIIAPVRESLDGKLPDELRPRMAALVRNVGGRSASDEIRTALQGWIKNLESNTLHDRLIENIAAEPWSHHFEEAEWRKRVTDIAQELYNDPDVFEKELEWLTSNDAKGAAELGHIFGRLDSGSLRFLKEIFDAALEHKAEASG
jgi:hypothetical protein